MEKQATNFAIRLMNCKDIKELQLVSDEIRKYMVDNSTFKTEWRDWLLDIHWSKNKELTTPEVRFEDTLNIEGKKALKKGLI